MTGAVLAGLFSIALVCFVSWRSYRSGYDMGYRIGREEAVNWEEKKRLDRAHMHRYGDYIRAGREGRN